MGAERSGAARKVAQSICSDVARRAKSAESPPGKERAPRKAKRYLNCGEHRLTHRTRSLRVTCRGDFDFGSEFRIVQAPQVLGVGHPGDSDSGRTVDTGTEGWYISRSPKGELSGSNSAVECDLAKVDVAGSNPVSRSKTPRSSRRPRAGAFRSTGSAGPSQRPLTRSRIRNELLTTKSMTLPDVLKSSSMVERERCRW